MMKSFSLAYNQMTSSPSVSFPYIRGCVEPGYKSASLAGSLWDKLQSNKSFSLDHHRKLLSVYNISETGKNIFLCQIRKIIQYFFVGHPGSKIAEHIINCNPESSDAWFPASFPRFYCYCFFPIHTANLNFLEKESRFSWMNVDSIMIRLSSIPNEITSSSSRIRTPCKDKDSKGTKSLWPSGRITLSLRSKLQIFTVLHL